ncbi:hypothetical protein [Mycolicibacterium sp. P1-5]|uniref:hypothetical protein n=1 Tax=Mycolicibacterium sp. P1-5 TaxID=2024617 RepID=UPI0011EC8EC5|nr:hypothetical protein [Mycolicibacterium sp. P1-5]KAA0107750.1 hypothetical protein CIW47_17680 [Mycolicibacterium sp. P1-5]
MSNIKTLSAVVGGSAIVAMGGLGIAVTEQGSGMIVSDPGTFTSPVTSSMTTGETSKSTTVEPTQSPASASPPVTATTPEAP